MSPVAICVSPHAAVPLPLLTSRTLLTPISRLHVHTTLQIIGVPEVDAAVDAVGFEARGCGHNHSREVPAQVLNDCMNITKAAGAIGIPGLYVTEDPGAGEFTCSNAREECSIFGGRNAALQA